MIGIYKITSPTKKIYIGQSINIERRFSTYKRNNPINKQPRLYGSFKKHGVDKHKFEIICECEVIELNDKERYYQDLYSAIYKKGLNCKLTTSKDRSGKLSDATKQKISLSNKGKKMSLESIEKSKKTLLKTYKNGFINPRKGVILSNETKLKLSISHTGKKLNINHKEKIRLSLIGHKRLVGRKLTESHKLNCKLNATKYKSKIILDFENGIFYDSAKELSMILNIPHSTLRCKLNGTVINKTNYRYV